MGDSELANTHNHRIMLGFGLVYLITNHTSILRHNGMELCQNYCNLLWLGIYNISIL